MKQKTSDRDHAIRNMARLGITPRDQARLLRLGATLHRLAEAECNGDWPCDNGERPTSVCGAAPVIGYRIKRQEPDPYRPGFTREVWQSETVHKTHGEAAGEVTPTSHRVVKVYTDQSANADGCGAYYAPSALRKSRGYLCPSCCAEEDAGKIAASYKLRAVVNGDPRGGVLYLVPQDASREDVDSGRVRGEFVR